MKALSIDGHGDISRLDVRDVPDPGEPGPGQVRLSVHAAALNRLDIFTMRGLPGLELEFPHVLAGDGAGLIDAVGPGVTGVKVGDKVLVNPGVSCHDCEFCQVREHSLCVNYQLLGEHLQGLAADFALVPARNAFPIPETPPSTPDISWAEAAAFGLVTLTAWRMMVTRARVTARDTVLIWGIGGGVASAALQIAKLKGARVIATSSSDDKLERARELGADHTVNHAHDDVATRCRDLTDRRGVDVVIEHPGEATWKSSLKALAKQGRLVTCGGTTGPHVVTDVRRLFWNQYTIMGSTMGNEAEFQAIVDLLGQGELRPVIDEVFPIDAGVQAVQRMQYGDQMGKIVIAVA